MSSGIRLASPADAAALCAIYAPYVRQTPVSFEYEAPSAAEFERRICKTMAAYPYLVYVSDGKPVGYACAHRLWERAAYAWDVELSVYLAEEAMRKGYGSALYTALLELLRMQQIQNAYALVTVPNPGSERLHERMGFQRAGILRSVGYKCGAWQDVAWFEKRLCEESSPPPPFIPFPMLNLRTVAEILRKFDVG